MSVLQFSSQTLLLPQYGAAPDVPPLPGEDPRRSLPVFALAEDEELFEGYGLLPSLYPYRCGAPTGKAARTAAKTAVLESARLRAVFLPEYGGQLFSLVDKKTGVDLLGAPHDPAALPGVSWHAGLDGLHEAPAPARLYTARTQLPDGTPVLRFYEYERIRRLFWQLDFWIRENDRFLSCRVRLVNDGERVVPAAWWSRMRLPLYPGGLLLLPAREYYQEKGRIVRRAALPESGLGDAFSAPSSLTNLSAARASGYALPGNGKMRFFALRPQAPLFAAHLDRHGYGLLHLSTARLAGRGAAIDDGYGTETTDKTVPADTRGRGTAFPDTAMPAGSRRHSTETADKAASGNAHGRGVSSTSEAARKRAPAAGPAPSLQLWAGLSRTPYGSLPMPPHTAWEWLERYGPLQLTPEEISGLRSDGQPPLYEISPLRPLAPLPERAADCVAARIRKKGADTALENALEKSHTVAVSPAELLYYGSGYGSFAELSERTEHLTFVRHESSLRRWASFFDSGLLHSPAPAERPDEFLIDAHNAAFLERSLRASNAGNWYAFYQHGVYLASARQYDRAKESLRRSLRLAENPWARALLREMTHDG